MSGIKHARMMLETARKDLKATESMMDTKSFEPEIFGFHAQQTVEKALKAWLSLIEAEYPKTHDLDQLFALLKKNGAKVPDEFGELAELSDFAVQYRYEPYEQPSEELDRKNMAEKAGRLLAHVQNLLP